MELGRREFLKLGGVGIGGFVLLRGLNSKGNFGVALGAIPLKKRIGETPSICAYCAGGCGILVAAEGDNLISIEGY